MAEIQLNPAKLKRLTAHYESGGTTGTPTAETVLRMKKPAFVAAYMAEAQKLAGLKAEEAPAPTPEASTPEPTPTPEASTPEASTPEPTPTPDEAPAPTPASPTSAKAQPAPEMRYRFIDEDGLTRKIQVMKAKGNLTVFEEIPKEPAPNFAQIILSGEALTLDVNKLNAATTEMYRVQGKDYALADIRTLVELSRA